MTVRKGAKRNPLDSAIANLPARFYEAEVYTDHGNVTGLQAYMADLSDHLSRKLGTEDPPTVEVMTALGIPPSEWYRLLLSTEPTNGETTE